MRRRLAALARDRNAAETDVAGRVVALSQTDPPAEATEWTAAMTAKAVDISASSVHRIRREHGLQPHRVKQCKLSTDS